MGFFYGQNQAARIGNVLILRTLNSNNTTLYISRDNGVTWTEETYITDNLAPIQSTNSVVMSSDSMHWIIRSRKNSTNSVMMISHDGGNTFFDYSQNAWDGWPAISDNGQLILFSGYSPTDSLELSNNGGLSFNNIGPGGSIPFTSMSANGKYIIVAADDPSGTVDGRVQYSNDYGATFSFSNSSSGRMSVFSSDDGRYCLHFANSRTVTPKAPQLSVDFGITWNNILDFPIDDINMRISRNGKYMIGFTNSGTAKQSSDYGSTWNSILINGSAPGFSWPFSSVEIANNGTHSITKGNIVYYSIDFGATYSTSYNFSSIGTVIWLDVPRNGNYIGVTVQVGANTELWIANVSTPTSYTKVKTIPNSTMAVGYF